MSTAHDPVPYEEGSSQGYSERAADRFELVRHARRYLVASGPCPRCNAHLEIPIVTEAVRALGNGGPASGGTEVPMYCECEGEHPGRPDGEEGCGAYWLLVVPGDLT
ncbi:hypothetical protein [Streptomyces griseoruber]|uniref:Uncharacterized protein n=1 Tax=Streptomyces griseoruber TaxID=1943 RepID=A0A117RA02_9ACTN|nr:hypothetical protein [Streptomyces griseoruber]KUN79275.1 hypothetical protein AQJ64_29865 [Streptomyces griseoruber]